MRWLLRHRRTLRKPIRFSNRDGASDSGAGVEIPMNAACGRAQRINLAARTADENAPARIGGMRVGAQLAGKAEGPFQLEPRHLIPRESGGRRILKARV